jgi:hypothetical protein
MLPPPCSFDPETKQPIPNTQYAPLDQFLETVRADAADPLPISETEAAVLDIGRKALDLNAKIAWKPLHHYSTWRTHKFYCEKKGGEIWTRSTSTVDAPPPVVLHWLLDINQPSRFREHLAENGPTYSRCIVSTPTPRLCVTCVVKKLPYPLFSRCFVNNIAWCRMNDLGDYM